MKIFVTGHRGYIGPHLVDVLKREGHAVVGCDLGLFEGCNWEPMVDPDVELVKDVRAVEAEDLDGCDCVMHLAAISNDPMGELNAQLTFDVNRDASIRLARIAKRAGVPRFLFAGSCSIYGKGEKLDLDEGDPLNPLTAYAKSKIETERAVSELADATFSPAYLRNATAYGHSPVLRIDLVVNNLLASAMAYGEIRIQSDGSPWRPLIHCRDIARAFAAFAAAPREAIHDQAINVGGNKENYQVRDVGDQVQRLIPSAKVVYTGEVGADPRNYRVNFDKLSRHLPDFRLQYNLVSGMEELHRKMVEHGFSKKDFEGDQFVRLRTLKGRFNLLKFIARVIMIFTETPLEGSYLIDLEKRGDDRGFFARAFCQREFAEHGLVDRFVQANNSLTARKGTLRGMHYQLAPKAETKMVRCVRGSLLDVILDLREGSPTFGQSFAAELSAENRRMMYVPKGFAHGFFTLSDDAEALYFVDEFYAPECERGVRWDDPRFAIAWPGEPAVLSDKDRTWRDFDPAWHLKVSP